MGASGPRCSCVYGKENPIHENGGVSRVVLFEAPGVYAGSLCCRGLELVQKLVKSLKDVLTDSNGRGSKPTSGTFLLMVRPPPYCSFS